MFEYGKHLSAFVSPIFIFMAFAQIFRATRPITAYRINSIREKKDKLGPKSLILIRDLNSIHISEPV
jgi:hypothetical protein